MKGKQTTKHKKQVKKEKANRKAKTEVTTAEKIYNEPDTVPMSPARRAFKDI